MSSFPPLHRPRHPLVGLALAAAGGILLSDSWRSAPLLPISVVLVVVAVFALVRQSSIATYLAVGLAFALLHHGQIVDTPGLRLAQILGHQPEALTVTGVVITDPKISATGYASFVFRLNSIAWNDRTLTTCAPIYVRWKGTPRIGDSLQLYGLAHPIEPPRNPGEFDMRSWLARQDVYHELSVHYSNDGSFLARRPQYWIRRAAEKSRHWMQQTLTRDLDDAPDVKALITGMVLGVRHQTADDIEEPFQQTGTLHLFAVAGLHVGIIAQLLWIIASLARLRRRLAIALIIPALFFYSAITGLHSSSMRAAVMAAVLLGGFVVERRVFALNSIGAAALLLLTWDTDELFSVGFQLSFCVVAAIILWADPIARRLHRFGEPDPFLPATLFSRTRRLTNQFLWWLSRAASVSLAALLGALPLMLWYFNLVTPISLIANLLVVPLAFFILGCGLLALVTAPFSVSLSVTFNNANWFLAKVILLIVQAFAQIPGGHFYAERPHWPRGATAEVTVLDLGKGGSAHLRAGGDDWLFDCGSVRDFERTVRNYLHFRGVDQLDGLLLSHGDAAHIGGAPSALEIFRPRRVIDNPAPDRSPVHKKLRAFLKSSQLSEAAVTSNQALPLSRRVEARILFPPAGFNAKVADDETFVIQIVIDQKPRLLFMFDSGVATEKKLLAQHIDLRSDILVKGQHRSGLSGSPDFLAAVQPRVIIATSRDFPNSENLSDDWCEHVRNRGIKLFRQDESGAVTVTLFDDHFEATACLTGETFRSDKR